MRFESIIEAVEEFVMWWEKNRKGVTNHDKGSGEY